MDMNRWIRQPTTIHALGVFAAGAGAALAQVTTGNHTVDAAIGVVAYVAVHCGINDHSADESAASALVGALLHLGQTQPTKLLGDAASVAGTFDVPPANVTK